MKSFLITEKESKNNKYIKQFLESKSMKTFKRLLSEVSQPRSEDELKFKEKHIIQALTDPNAEEHQFTGEIPKFKNLADYSKGEDKLVYESSDDLDHHYGVLTNYETKDKIHIHFKSDKIGNSTQWSKIHDAVRTPFFKKGYKDAEFVKWNGSIDDHISDLEKRRDDISSKKVKPDSDFEKEKIHKDLKLLNYFKDNKDKVKHITNKIEPHKPYVESYDLVPEDEKQEKTVHARKKRREIDLKILENVKPMAVVTPEGGEFDNDESHQKYKKSNMSKNTIISELNSTALENFYKRFRKKDKDPELTESFSEGMMKLEDGSSVKLSGTDSAILNKLFNQLSGSNKGKMQSTLMSNKKGFEEILSFARETA